MQKRGDLLQWEGDPKWYSITEGLKKKGAKINPYDQSFDIGGGEFTMYGVSLCHKDFNPEFVEKKQDVEEDPDVEIERLIKQMEQDEKRKKENEEILALKLKQKEEESKKRQEESEKKKSEKERNEQKRKEERAREKEIEAKHEEEETRAYEARQLEDEKLITERKIDGFLVRFARKDYNTRGSIIGPTLTQQEVSKLKSNFLELNGVKWDPVEFGIGMNRFVFNVNRIIAKVLSDKDRKAILSATRHTVSIVGSPASITISGVRIPFVQFNDELNPYQKIKRELEELKTTRTKKIDELRAVRQSKMDKLLDQKKPWIQQSPPVKKKRRF